MGEMIFVYGEFPVICDKNDPDGMTPYEFIAMFGNFGITTFVGNFQPQESAE